MRVTSRSLCLLLSLTGCGAELVTNPGGDHDSGLVSIDGSGGPGLPDGSQVGPRPDLNTAECAPGMTKACYTGAAGTLGVGACQGGVQTCDGNGHFPSACVGQTTPVAEVCDGIDNNCDGMTDEGVTNACGACGAVSPEICGNGLDDNCNGQIDEGCNGGTCDPQCGCAGGLCMCHPPTHQPCYDGPPQTSGVGTCHGGFHDCLLQQGGTGKWGTCSGEVTPSTPSCTDGLDHNCNGINDQLEGQGCPCTAGASRACGSNVGECRRGSQMCTGGVWGSCSGAVMPQPETCDGKDNNCNGLTDEGVTNACGSCGPTPMEVCGNGLDDNCNGKVDEGCDCGGKTQQACYGGVGVDPKTRHVGACKDGMEFCSTQEVGSGWGDCLGQVTPTTEICGNGIDDNCNGATDEGCICTPNQTRACGSSVGECKPGTQTCSTVGAWSACMGAVGPTPETCDAKDNNCNGLTDEGVLNACGTCPPAPCFTQDYTMPGDCSQTQRTCNGVVKDPNNPAAITLGDTQNQLLPYIYIAVTNKNEVAQINTETGQKVWQKPSYGQLPSRTAVALDGSVWIGNRCLAGNPQDPTCSNMVHLDLNGNLICRADVLGIVRGVAIDADGNVWAGQYNAASVTKVDGKAVDTTQSPPRCKVMGTVPFGGAPFNVYGVAIDGRGFLWTSTTPTKKVDTKTLAVVATVDHAGNYGIAIDQKNRVWFGGWLQGTDMNRIDGDAPYTQLRTGITTVTAVTVHPDGSVWGSDYARGGVDKISLDAGGNITNKQYFANPMNVPNTHGIAVDRAGKLWSPERFTGYVVRWTPQGAVEQRIAVDAGNELYSYSDMTGIELRTITTREGHWLEDYDSGYPKAIWDHAEWTASIPNGTTVTVNVRAADTEAQFAGGGATQYCGPFDGTQMKASFAACPFLNNHRWLQADVKLGTTVDGVKPSVSDVKMFWSY